MLNLPIVRLVVAFLGAAFHFASTAACVVVASHDAVVRIAASTVHIHGKLPVRLPNCNQLTVESGRVSACYLAKNGQRTCSNVEAGAMLSTAGTSDASSTEVFGATLLAIAKGDAATKFGQTRNLGLVVGMPYGRVFPEVDLAIPWPSAALGDLRDFSVEALDNQTNVKTVALLQNGYIRFSSSLLAGVRYRWRAQTSKDELTGQFRTASEGDVEYLLPKIKELRTSGISAEGVALLVSELWLDEGYAFNAYLETARAGLRSPE